MFYVGFVRNRPLYTVSVKLILQLSYPQVSFLPIYPSSLIFRKRIVSFVSCFISLLGASPSFINVWWIDCCLITLLLYSRVYWVILFLRFRLNFYPFCILASKEFSSVRLLSVYTLFLQVVISSLFTFRLDVTR